MRRWAKTAEPVEKRIVVDVAAGRIVVAAAEASFTPSPLAGGDKKFWLAMMILNIVAFGLLALLCSALVFRATGARVVALLIAFSTAAVTPRA